MIDRKFLGYATTPSSVRIDPWRVRLFCQAIGERNPVYTDEAAAQSAGHRACPVPPTFLKALESEHCGSATLLQTLEVPVRSVLHAEQDFTYLQPVHVGDEVEMSRTVTDLYDKRGGAMSFIVVQTRYSVSGTVAARSVQTILVRNSQPSAA